MDQADKTRQFRQALGSFATGVTIVTTSDGQPVGVTANSFNSVSLDPPLVLWSLARSSGSMDAFRDSGHFAVHILGAHQEEMSGRFARSGADKFEGIGWREGVAGSPVLDDFSALFECRTVESYDGGDHVIFVGQVENFERRDSAPLLFHAGRYAEARPRTEIQDASADLPEDGRFTQDFLMYLLSRAHFQSSAATRSLWLELGLTETDMLVLSALSMKGPLDRASLLAELEHTGLSPDDRSLDGLLARGLVVEDRGLHLGELGQTAFIRILALSKAVENELVKSLGPNGAAELKGLLRKVIDASSRLEISSDSFHHRA
jgi:3-hydroxy-9,10-secoandrosta-1,3,5(10)-triene-9,17-dione monooxygenase reductase component